MNATKERQAWCCLQVKLCDPCLSALCVPWCKKALYKYSSFHFLLYRPGPHICERSASSVAFQRSVQPGTDRLQALADISRSGCVVSSNETRASIANPPNSARLGSTAYHSPKLHPGPCSIVGVMRGTDRQTHRRA